MTKEGKTSKSKFNTYTTIYYKAFLLKRQQIERKTERESSDKEQIEKEIAGECERVRDRRQGAERKKRRERERERERDHI